jgi:hypothetical protein
MEQKHNNEQTPIETTYAAIAANPVLGVVFMSKKIKVTNCRECPFANNDNDYGYCDCNATDKIILIRWEELPKDKVHELCPLKAGNIMVSLNNA